MRDVSERARELQEVYAGPSPYPMVQPFSLCKRTPFPHLPPWISLLLLSQSYGSHFVLSQGLSCMAHPHLTHGHLAERVHQISCLPWHSSTLHQHFPCFLDLSSWFNSYLYWCHYLKQNKTTSKTHLTWKYRYKVKFEEVSRSIFFKQNLYLWFSFKSELC